MIDAQIWNATVAIVVDGNLMAGPKQALREAINQALLRHEMQSRDDPGAVRECTLLLQAVDCLLSAESARAIEQFDAEAQRDLWREIVWWEVAASRLRAIRRDAVAAGLDRLAEQGPDDRFRTDVVLPLLRRAWIPRLFYEDEVDELERSSLERADAVALEQWAAERAAIEGHQSEWIDRYLNELAREPDPVANATAVYLRGSLLAYRNHGRHPIEQPALIIGGSWHFAHLVDLILVHCDDQNAFPEVGVYLNPESLTNATVADRESDLERRSIAVFPGDFPGGFDHGAPVPVQGRSAGVALTAAFRARRLLLAPNRTALVTAAINRDGVVEPLTDDVPEHGGGGVSQLRQKGRLFGLLRQLDGALLDRYQTLYAARENLDALREGAVSTSLPRDQVEKAILPIAGDHDFIGTLLEDIYRPLLEQNIRTYARFAL